MSDKQELIFTPPWHQFGDADHPGFAVFYGIAAMATIWAFESLVHRILFSPTDETTTSEVATLVTFEGSSWFRIVKWLLTRNNDATTDGPDESPTFRKRPFLGTLLRLVVICADIVIIILAVPREVNVYDKDTGLPQINFNGAGEQLLPEGKNLVAEFNPCIWDKLLFGDNFTPFVAILVCSTSTSFEIRELDPGDNTGALGMVVAYNETMERLEFKLQGENITGNTEFFITHNVFIRAGDERKATTLSLPLPKLVVSQAVRALATAKDFTSICTPPLSPESNLSWYLIPCTAAKMPLENDFRRIVIVSLLNRIFTTRVDAPLRKIKPGGEVVNKFFAIGVMNRPRLCIYPSLVLLLLLTLLNILHRLWMGGDHSITNLFNFVTKVAGLESPSNPFFVEESILQGAEDEYHSFGEREE